MPMPQPLPQGVHCSPLSVEQQWKQGLLQKCLSFENASIGDMVSQALITRFMLRIVVGMEGVNGTETPLVIDALRAGP